MPENTEIKKGALLSYITVVFNIAAGLIYTPWMVQQIGKSDYGLYMLVSTFVAYFVMDFGLGQSIARFLSNYRAAGKEAEINNFLGLAARVYSYISLGIFVLLIILFFFIDSIFLELTLEEIEKFKVVYIIAGLYSIVSFPFMSLNGILIAYEKFVFLKFMEFLSKIGLILFMIIALLIGYRLFALVAINAFVGLIIVVIKLMYIRKKTDVKIKKTQFDKVLFRSLFGFSIWLTIISIGQRINLTITPTILGILSGTEAIAIFSVGMILEAYVWTFADALNGLFLPKVSKSLHTTKNLTEINALMIRVGRIQLMIIGMLLIGLITLGKEFIGFWIGSDFIKAYYVMVLLIAPSFISVTQAIAGTMLYVVNEIKYRAFLVITGAFLSIGISIYLVPAFGAVGPAIAIFTSGFLFNIIGINLVYWKVLDLNIYSFFMNCHFKLMIPILLSFVFGLLIHFYLPAHNLISFLPKALLLGVFYIFIMWFLGMNMEEKALVKNSINAIKGQINKK